MRFLLIVYTRHVPKGRVVYEGEVLPLSQLMALSTLREYPRYVLLVEDETGFHSYEVRSGVMVYKGRITWAKHLPRDARNALEAYARASS